MLPRHEAEPGGKISAAGKSAQVWREGEDRAGLGGTGAWNRA